MQYKPIWASCIIGVCSWMRYWLDDKRHAFRINFPEGRLTGSACAHAYTRQQRPLGFVKRFFTPNSRVWAVVGGNVFCKQESERGNCSSLMLWIFFSFVSLSNIQNGIHQIIDEQQCARVRSAVISSEFELGGLDTTFMVRAKYSSFPLAPCKIFSPTLLGDSC